jgi:hypothetical protein
MIEKHLIKIISTPVNEKYFKKKKYHTNVAHKNKTILNKSVSSSPKYLKKIKYLK